MKTFEFSCNHSQQILALGAESAGNFCVFSGRKINFSENFGDLLLEENYQKYKNELIKFLKKEKIEPDVILSDLHPLMKTTLWGKELAKRYQAQHIQIQHHHAHIFSAIGEKIIQDTEYEMQDMIYGIALDGTGFGEDEKIWGGRVLGNFQFPISNHACRQAGFQSIFKFQ